jgi:hypothetical protein
MIIDKRKGNIIYVDKENNDVAHNEEVLKLINTNNDSVVDIYINIISGVYKLNSAEATVIKILIDLNGTATRGILCNNVARSINKSPITASRAIDSLRDKRLIYVTVNGYITLSNSIDITNKDISKIKVIVINSITNISSNKVSI